MYNKCLSNLIPSTNEKKNTHSNALNSQPWQLTLNTILTFRV